MAIEISPSTDGLELTTQRTTTPEFGSVTRLSYAGPATSLETVEEQYVAQALHSGIIGSIELSHSRGRGTLAVNFDREWADSDTENQTVQELRAYDNVKPIYSATYFRDIGVALIASVRECYEAQLTSDEEDAFAAAADATWGLRTAAGKAWKLLGHLKLGIDSYNETAYEFTQTWKTTSSRQLQIAASNNNTIQDLPALSATMSNLVDTLPDGEWLKRPTTVQSVGDGMFQVRTSYLWAKLWSIVYGGTETGL